MVHPTAAVWFQNVLITPQRSPISRVSPHLSPLRPRLPPTCFLSPRVGLFRTFPRRGAGSTAPFPDLLFTTPVSGGHGSCRVTGENPRLQGRHTHVRGRCFLGGREQGGCTRPRGGQQGRGRGSASAQTLLLGATRKSTSFPLPDELVPGPGGRARRRQVSCPSGYALTSAAAVAMASSCCRRPHDWVLKGGQPELDFEM